MPKVSPRIHGSSSGLGEDSLGKWRQPLPEDGHLALHLQMRTMGVMQSVSLAIPCDSITPPSRPSALPNSGSRHLSPPQ